MLDFRLVDPHLYIFIYPYSFCINFKYNSMIWNCESALNTTEHTLDTHNLSVFHSFVFQRSIHASFGIHLIIKYIYHKMHTYQRTCGKHYKICLWFSRLVVRYSRLSFSISPSLSLPLTYRNHNSLCVRMRRMRFPLSINESNCCLFLYYAWIGAFETHGKCLSEWWFRMKRLLLTDNNNKSNDNG